MKRGDIIYSYALKVYGVCSDRYVFSGEQIVSMKEFNKPKQDPIAMYQRAYRREAELIVI